MSDSDNDSENEKFRRSKRSVVVKFQFEDSSSDDSDVDGPSNSFQSSKRCRKKIATSTDESSSDNDFTLALIQRKNDKKFKENIADADSDESSDDSWNPMKAQCSSTSTAPKDDENTVNQVLSDNECSSESDSSSCDSMEKCPICLHSFRDQEIGAPNVCDHSFCAPCIEEWSSNVQTCPIDRKPFTSIKIRSRFIDGIFLRETNAKTKAIEPNIELDFTNCEVCNRSDREEIMLLCDGCDAGYHMDCLVPQLTEIPEGSWYCDNCFASDTSEDDDITQVLAEMESIAAPSTRLRVRREIIPRITRTRQSERIRATIRNRRQENQNQYAAVESNSSLPGLFFNSINSTIGIVIESDK